MSGEDRRVHATGTALDGGGFEIVRYDRAGKWYFESDSTRRLLTVKDAAAFVGRELQRPGFVWHQEVPGGQRFDAEVRKVRGGLA